MRHIMHMLLGFLAFSTLVYAQPEPNQVSSSNQGILQLPKGISLYVISPAGAKMTIEPGDGRAMLPIGTYKMRHWVYQKSDTDGNVWRLEGYGGPIKSFNISQEPTSLDIKTAPINASLRVYAGDNYVFSISLKSPDAGTIYIYDQKQSRPPSLEITNQDKSYLVTLTGKYG